MQQPRRNQVCAHPGQNICARWKNCSVGVKAEKAYGPDFFWVLGAIPKPGSDKDFEYYIIPSQIMAENVYQAHQLWLMTPGKKGQARKDNKVRTVHLPPYKSFSGWDISE